MSLWAQDDLYYMPSQDNDEDKKVEQAKPRYDTTGMTDYQKYRAMRDGNASEIQEENQKNSDTSSKQTDNDQIAPDFTSVDTAEDGSVVVNNYFFEDNDWRYSRYRSFYFDYYDPFYWDYYPHYGYFGYDHYWGSPYYGWSWSIGFHSPYYDYYWGRPSYWYHPFYHSGYYGYGHYGYYDGYYHGYYSGVYDKQRSNLNSSGGSRRGLGQYTAGSAGIANGSSYGVSNRRTASSYSTNTNVVSSRRGSSANYTKSAVSSRRDVNSVQTTRPAQGTNRRSSTYYVPSYNRNDDASYGASRRSSANQGNTSNSRVYNSRGNSNSTRPEATTTTPRRSSESYSPPTRTQSQPTYSGSDNSSRRSSGSSYSGGSSYSPSRSSGSSSGSSNSGSSSSSSSGGGGGRRR